MSTKTTFKRIALVTVAALGFGAISMAPPASATTTTVLTSVSVTGSTAGTAADPFAVGSAINLNVLIDLTSATTAGETFTITYNAYNPKGETITGITLVETATSVSLLGNGTDTGTVAVIGNSLAFETITTAAASTVATLTIPAAGITTGGTYTVKATKISSSAGSITLAANNLDGTTSVARGQISVAGAQVTQGTLTGSAAGNAVTGNNARMKFFFPKVAADDVYRITSSGVGTILSEQGDGANTTPSAVSGTTYASGMNLVAASANTASNVELNLSSDVAGEQKLTFWKQNASTGVLTAVFTGTVTWGAAPAYVGSTAFISTTTGSSATADTLAADRKSSAVYSATEKARISVKQYTDAANTIQTAGTAKAVVVTITGAGAVDTVASNGATRGSQATVAASTTASTDSEFYVYSDGRAGSATIAVTVNGVEVKSWAWSFYGTATSLKEDADNSPEKTYIGVGETGTLSVFSYDANSVLVSEAPSVNATSDTTTVATVTSTGTGSVTVTGVATGKTNINICVGACSTATVKLAIPVEITKVSAASAGVTMAFDKASYEPGEKMVLTVSAVDSNGRPVADGARSLFSAAVTANVSFGGASVALPGTSVALAGGVKTYTLYAPSSSGTVTVTGKEGTSVALTEKAAGTAAGVAYVAKTITASAVVLNSAVDAATDAANEAVDAANAATDAALAAAEAADAATTAAQEASDAVAALSESVTKLIAGLQNQIKSLAAVVAKIAKKVKA